MAEYNSFPDVSSPLDSHKWPVQDSAFPGPADPPGELLSLAQALAHILESPVDVTGDPATIKLINTAAETWEITSGTATGRLTFKRTGGATPCKFGKDAVENLLRVGVIANDEVTIDGDLVVTGSISDQAFKPGFEVGDLVSYMAQARSQGHLPDVPKEKKLVLEDDVEEKAVINVGDHFEGQLMAMERLFFFVENLQEENQTLRDRIDALEAR